MKISNLDTGLRKTLVAAFRSKGIPKAGADAMASKHLPMAEAHFRKKLAGAGRAISKAAPPKTAKGLSANSSKRLAFAGMASLKKRRREPSPDSTQAVSAALRAVAKWARALP